MALISRADDLSIWEDETWSIFHSSRTLSQITTEVDLLWPFGYFALLHLWSNYATQHDFALRALSVFFGVLAVAFMIRAGRSLFSPTAGLLAALAFGTSSYALSFLLELRGYSPMLLLEAIFVYVYAEWHKKATLRRSIALLVTQIAMMYIYFGLFVVIGLAVFHMLISRPRLFLKWLPLGFATVFAFLPLLPQFLETLSARSRVLWSDNQLPAHFVRGFDTFYRAYSAHWDAWFAVIVILVIFGLFFAVRRLGGQTFAWLLIWGIGIPLLAFITRERSALFTTRYLSFTMPAVFLLIGIGLSALPRQTLTWAGTAAILILALAPWQPFDHRPSYSDYPPVRDFMRAMARMYQPGDWLVIDPALHRQPNSLEWWYYKNIYFPNGHFQFAKDGTQAGRRVWHLVRQGSEDHAITASVQRGRLMRAFWGPWYFIATLYEAPPQAEPIHFGESLKFHGADIKRTPVVHTGDTLEVTLWWSTDQPLPADYSISLYLLDPTGQLVAQVDGPPRTQGTPEQLSAWQPEMLYLDQRRIEVPYRIPYGSYTLAVAVYQWWDGVRLVPSQNSTPDRIVIIDQFPLWSYAFG